MTEWSEEQKKAIYLRDRELLVSAAAGSGKTSVLVERIVTMVTDSVHPIDVDRLLVVTFTKAAAAEMRTRLYKSLLERAKNDPENMHVRKQLTLIGQAHVQTIDSFCSAVLRNHFHTIELDPAFRIGDEGELTLLMSDTLSDLLERKYQEANPKFLAMTDYFATGRLDEKLEEIVTKLYNFSQTAPDPEAWLDRAVEPYRTASVEALNRSEWSRSFLLETMSFVEECKRECKELLELVQRPGSVPKFDEKVEEDLAALNAITGAAEYDALREQILALSFRGNPSFGVTAEKKGCSKVLYEECVRIRDYYKKRMESVRKIFRQEGEAVIEGFKVALPAVEALISFVKEFSEEYKKAKLDRGIIDFNDGEHLCLRILMRDGKPTDVAKAISEEFEEILIDEYQDSNLLQELILRAVSKEWRGKRNIFMVGDMKQSIYRFRNACPALFVDKYNRFSAASEEVTGEGQKIELNANYRSRSCVTEPVNYFFKKLMHKEVGEIDYTEKEALRPMGTFPETENKVGGPLKLLLVKTQHYEDEAENRMANRSEAEAIAQEIRRIVDPEHGQYVTQKEGYRKAAYRDIVILLRGTKGLDRIYSDVLTSYGIPSYVDRKTGFYDTFEVRFVMNLLTVIANPIDDIALAAVLRSPIYGFSSEELATVRVETGYRTQNGFFGRIKHYLEANPEAVLAKKLAAFLETVERFRKRSNEVSLSAFIREVYRETGIVRFAGAMAGGDRRVANLNQLIIKASDFENLSFKGVFNFVRYISKKKELESDEGEVSISGENDDLVRIITIHASKGLEYPFVFVAGLSKPFNKMDRNQSVCMHQDLGIGVDVFRTDKRTKGATYYKMLMRERMAEETYGEELRILYVAMTRAKERLYLCAGIDELEDEMASRSELWNGEDRAVLANEILAANSYIKWILNALNQCAPVEVCPIFGEVLRAGRIFGDEADAEEADALRERLSEAIAKQTAEEVDAMLSFDYHIDDLSEIPETMSVSALKMAAMEAADGPDREYTSDSVPIFRDNKDLITGAARGTLYHWVMEHMNPHENVSSALERFTACGLTSEAEKSTIDEETVMKFWRSSLGTRFQMAYDAGKGFREQQFIIALPISEVLSGRTVRDPEETVMIQGVIDMFFEDPDGLVLVDYKTDRISNPDVLVARYKTQLIYYAKALTMLTGKPVKEMWIYSFALHKEILL